ncbi:hypothetical protein CYMTET_22306 [Cymbomonas tetramitiformis]|uniref:Uncharacterized protein n=1 Tax=Cymbomonas tetramitiformis TaxID=36881 RepID=A0AAE0G062_9CHLO|nr:hypothetical protein CYMTET_22306 [Cymbomonas tetramitiformis]
MMVGWPLSAGLMPFIVWGLLIIVACGECVKGFFTTLEVEMPPMFVKGSHWDSYYLLILSALGVHNLRMKYRNLVRVWVIALILMIPRIFESACVPELIHTTFFSVSALCVFETWAHGKK